MAYYLPIAISWRVGGTPFLKVLALCGMPTAFICKLYYHVFFHAIRILLVNYIYIYIYQSSYIYIYIYYNNECIYIKYMYI